MIERVVQNRIENLSSSTVTAIVEQYLLRTKNTPCKAAVLNGKSEMMVICEIFLDGHIDVGDGCWRRNALVSMIRY